MMAVLSRIPKKRRSVFANVVARQHGNGGEGSFERGVSLAFEEKCLLHDPELVSPHRRAVTSLNVDVPTGRFVLAGSADGTISIYDVSPWGRDAATATSGGGGGGPHRPVARSVKVRVVPDGDDEGGVLDLPGGHSSSVTHVQWYPTDAGAFVSASADGTVLVWDTHRMRPVLAVRPFDAGWVSAHLRGCGYGGGGGGDGGIGPPLLVAGSQSGPALTLVDVRSGAASHQLVGHQDGITAVQWSPANPHVLASGSRDSTVRLWDIRKSGSRACITVLDREHVAGAGGAAATAAAPYATDCSHLRAGPSSARDQVLLERQRRQRQSQASYSGSGSMKRRRLPPGAEGGGGGRYPSSSSPHATIAPNNYDHLQRQQARSHNGHVAALAYLGGGGHRLASVGGADGEVVAWDLRTGRREATRFSAPGGLPASSPGHSRVALLSAAGGSGRGGRSSDAAADFWIGRGDRILGFGRDGGSPTQVLEGHLAGVSCLERMEPGGGLLSGSKDGMLLCWGRPRAAVTLSGRPAPSEDADNW